MGNKIFIIKRLILRVLKKKYIYISKPALDIYFCRWIVFFRTFEFYKKQKNFYRKYIFLLCKIMTLRVPI